MLSFLSGGTSFCDGLTRREVLRVGGWGALGLLGASSPMSVASTSSVPIRFGQAKTVVLVTLYGGPPQTETFDMKPDAPLEVRGPFRPIRTNVVGVEICEHLPRLAGLAHLYTLA